MTINTKFNLGEKVFIIYESSVVKVSISRISVEVTKNSQSLPEPVITYRFDGKWVGNTDVYRYESEIGGSVEHLIKAMTPVEMV
jgi:hypothetical protein